jgi:hypothetical protein
MLVTLGTIVVLPVILDYVGLGSAWPKQSSAASLAHSIADRRFGNSHNLRRLVSGLIQMAGCAR